MSDIFREPQKQLLQIKDLHWPINQTQQRHNTPCSFTKKPFFMRLISLIFIALMVHTANALSCYETVNGVTSIKQNPTWMYCSLVPSIEHGEENINGTRFGVGPENDGLEAYQSAFGNNDQLYRVLTVCIYERYDFSRFMGRKPGTAVEFAFRCVCNYDLCNSEATFHSYLKDLKKESFIGNQ